MQPVLSRRGDAGLVLAAEGVRVARVGARPAAVSRTRATRRERAGRQADGGDAASDQSASRDPVQDSTAAVSWDNGSESALTALTSALISSWVRSS